MKHWLRQPTWWCAFSPLVFLMLLFTLAIHIRWKTGYWPQQILWNCETPFFAMHWKAMELSMPAALVAAPVVWLILLLVPRFRISLRIHILQVLIYVLCWEMVALFLVSSLDPTSFTEWFLLKD